MVNLTNSTTSTPSVTDVVVSSTTPTNGTPSTISSSNISYVPTLASAGITTEITGNADITKTVTHGVYLANFAGGEIKSFNAYAYAAANISSVNAYFGVYLNGTIVFNSEAITLTNLVSGTNFWITLSGTVRIGEGNVIIAFSSDVENLYINYTDPDPSLPTIMYLDGVFSGTFASITSVTYFDNGIAPEIYITYSPLTLNNLYPRAAIWKDVTKTWDAATNTWETYVDNVQLSSI